MKLERHLNPEQIAAVTHGDGPQLVLAGAGSGKTRVITYRIAWLIDERGVEPYRVAAVTFTNKAAGEMRERVERLVGRSGETFVGTFHRFALRLLRRYGDRVGLPRDFTILDGGDQVTVIKRVLEACGLDTSVFAPRAVLGRISAAKNRLLGPSQFEAEATGFWDKRVAEAFREYQRVLRESAGIDFDDMIALAVRLLQEEQELGERMRRRLRHLLIDEFQDTNYAQLQLIGAISSEGGNLTAVGDEDQSIYRWRGAELANILEFEKHFPGATIRKLERNYRSTQTILDASGQLVAHNQMRRGKRLWTDRGAGERVELYRASDEGDEARWIVRTLQQLQGEYRYRQMAVLVRTNAQTRAIEDELLRRKVPYCLIAGVRFYERAEIKDLVAYLRLVRNPQDNLSLRRVLNVPPRGIGKATQQMLFREAEDMGSSLWDTLRLDRLGRISARGAKALRRFRDLVLELQDEAQRQSLPELLQRILDRTSYLDLYRRDEKDAESRRENIQEFLSAAQEFAEDFGPTEVPARTKLDGSQEVEEEVDPLTSFLDYVALVSDTDGLDTDLGVSLMTLHSAKGLEFPVVFIGGLENGLLPHYNSQQVEEEEEERRLLYVGMTRAERRLHLSACRRRRIAGRYQDQDPSPFLSELPSELVQVHESPQLFVSQRTASVQSFFARPQPAPRPLGPSTPTPASPRGDVALAPAAVPLREGVGVRHPKLGAGVILEVQGEGDNAKLTVYFDRAGKRRLIAKYAALEPLD